MASILTSEVAPWSAEALIVYSIEVGKVARSAEIYFASGGKTTIFRQIDETFFILNLLLWCQHQGITKKEDYHYQN